MKDESAAPAVSFYFILPPSSFLLTTPVGQHALDALLVGLGDHHVDV